eukprot:CAMPEP_0183796992 /NCGR_PEP_ID=MMETSP0803_2-20130417/13960_1 /TAXON_ID=195967 /ORGANISM="Crustomastix stigmata, Strain CCMP3273" /LENGTH=138 /DNA_ID=CAMNT_0026041651 /DNA_START=9 /DNA_END=422 /DNA_ORIENTATION=-
MVAWVLLRWCFMLPYWVMAVPAAAVVLGAWFLLGLSALHAAAKAQKEALAGTVLLSTEVPEGATGEVARVLGCDNHFSVLEASVEDDAAAIKKAHRRKAVMLHPDKNKGVPHTGEAFGRVQTAYEVLSDEGKRKEYME